MFSTVFSARAALLLQSSRNSLQCVCRRYLFSEKILRMKPFYEAVDHLKKALAGREDVFWKRVELLAENGEAPERDLKVACHIATEEEMLAVKKLLKIYMQTTRVGGYFRFGPILMRRLHQLNLPDIAIELFDDESFASQINTTALVNVYVDLLFENQRYEDLARSFDRWLKSGNQLAFSSSHLSCIYLLSLYKIGSPEAFEEADRFWETYSKRHSHLSITYVTYAAIQLKNMKPEKCLTTLALVDHRWRNGLRTNLQIQAHIHLGNWQMVENLLQELASFNSSLMSETRDMIIQQGKNPTSMNLLRICTRYSTVDEGLTLAPRNSYLKNSPGEINQKGMGW